MPYCCRHHQGSEVRSLPIKLYGLSGLGYGIIEGNLRRLPILQPEGASILGGRFKRFNIKLKKEKNVFQTNAFKLCSRSLRKIVKSRMIKEDKTVLQVYTIDLTSFVCMSKHTYVKICVHM